MRVAVVGGGIQGCTVALELARRDIDVELFERRTRIYEGASRHGEGKIHLGFVYAGDRTLRTARLMARGAAVFAPALRRWIGDGVDRLPVSTPFTYAVHRASMRSPDELEETYGRITALIDGLVPPAAYFGADRPGRVRRLEPGEGGGYGDDVAALFETAELAVGPDDLARALVCAVEAHPRIDVTTSTTVTAADRDRRVLRARDPEGERETPPFDHIVNCAWDGRLALDATTGLAPPPAFSFRMKYCARARLNGDAGRLPSTTIVLGPFGDVVDYGSGRAYLSWYPVGRRGWSSDLSPPAWPEALTGEDAERLAAGIGAGLAGVLPAAARVLAEHPGAVDVRGGVIYARGDTDVDDAASELHRRFEVGPSSHAGYHTVDTGKLTLAPLFALEVADRIEADGRG
jgi:hypothetical protein